MHRDLIPIMLHRFLESSLYLDEEIELDAIHEQERKLPREIWGLKEIRRVLLGVSDDEWFKEGGNMLDLTLDGPDRPSTFRKVFAGTPGAIYGCLKVRVTLLERRYLARSACLSYLTTS